MSGEIREPDLGLLARYRRDLHRIPELDFDLDETLAYVREQLRPLEVDPRVRLFSPCRSTLCCLFDRGGGRACAVRTDMDALPVLERTGAAYQSGHPGRMHACGHDGHMAMALGLARHLALHLDELPRSVLVVFQPAEETTGGAKVVCESGVFDRLGVDRIFGFHLWPDLPAGQVASRAGALLAASNEVDVEVRGVSSHIAKAELGRDALEAAAHVLLDCYAYMGDRRREEPCLLRFGHATSGAVRNQVSDLTRLEGSLRTFSVEMGERCRRELPGVAADAAARLGCTCEVHFSEGYPPVVNDPALFGLVASALPGLAELPEPLLIAEDFAWYQRHLPGVFLLLGCAPAAPLHSDAFDFDEAVLMRGLEAYERIVRIP